MIHWIVLLGLSSLLAGLLAWLVGMALTIREIKRDIQTQRNGDE